MLIQLDRTPARRSGAAHASRRGTAIVPALIVVVMVATLSMVYVQVSLAKSKEQRVSVDSKRAFYMAEAGLAEGFNGLCLGKSGNVASEAIPAVLGTGLFWTVATELGGGRVALEATGLCGAGRATLALTCERTSDTVGALGFFGDQNITVQDGALIDSYDSRAGSYASQATLAPLSAMAGAGAKVGGNSDINVSGTLLAPATIHGDVRSGPRGALLRSGNTVITGSTAPNSSRVTFPAVKVPPIAETMDIAVTGTTTRNLSTGQHGIGTLKADNGATIVLTGPTVLVVRRILLKNGAKLSINATDGPVKIFVTEGLKFDSGTTFNTSSTDPRSVSIQVSGARALDIDGDGVADTPVAIASSGAFHGSLYAPGTSVGILRGFDVFGAVVAQDLTVRTGGRLHFDRAFSSSADEASGTPRLLGWHIVELPNTALVSLRFDALTDLLRQGITPRLPKLAHFDIGVTPN